MANSELISSSDIKQEDASDVIDLGDFDEYEWNIKVLNKFKECIVSHSERTLDAVMRWYTESLREDARNFEDYKILRMYMLKHIQFFKLYFLELNCGFTDHYLDSMEDILAFYVDLEVKSVPLKDNNMRERSFRRIIKQIIHRILNMLNTCLLGKEERQYHALMKMKVGGISNETKDLLNILYRKFLITKPLDKSELAFCRAYILFQKWKKIHEPTEWPQMDRIVYEMFDQTPRSIKQNAILRQILLPNNRSICDVLTLITDNFTFILEEYFKYIKLDHFQEEGIVSVGDFSNDNVDEPLLYDREDGEDRLYNEYLKLFSGAGNNSNSVIKLDDDDDDDDCQIVGVISNNLDYIHEVTDNNEDDDDILEVILVRSKEDTEVSFLDSIDITAPPCQNKSRSQQPLSNMTNISRALPKVTKKKQTNKTVTAFISLDETPEIPSTSRESESNKSKNVVTVETQTETGAEKMDDGTTVQSIENPSITQTEVEMEVVPSSLPASPQVTEINIVPQVMDCVTSPHVPAAKVVSKENIEMPSSHVANLNLSTANVVSEEVKDIIANDDTHQANQTEAVSKEICDTPTQSISSFLDIEESILASPMDIGEIPDNNQQPVKIAEKESAVVDTTTKPTEGDVLSQVTVNTSIKPLENQEQPDSNQNLNFLDDWRSEPDSESADSGKYPKPSSSTTVVSKIVLSDYSKSLACSDISSTSLDTHENERNISEKNDSNVIETNLFVDLESNRSDGTIDSNPNLWMDETAVIAAEETCHLQESSNTPEPSSNSVLDNGFEEDLSSNDTLDFINQNIVMKSLTVNLENILEEKKEEPEPPLQKVMYTSPVKTCSNSNKTLHFRYCKLKETHDIDRILNGEVLSGPIAPVAKMNSSKSFDLFDNKISATTVEQISAQAQMPTDSSTDGDAELSNYDGKDDFQSYYRDSDMVPSPARKEKMPKENSHPVMKEKYDNSQNLGALEKNIVVHKHHTDTGHKSENKMNTVKKKRIIFSENLTDTENTRIHSPFENSNGTVHGIIKKTVAVDNEGSAMKRPRNRIPKRLMNLKSLAVYNIKPDDPRIQTDPYVKLQKITDEEISRMLRLGEVAKRLREEREQVQSLVRVDYVKSTSSINDFDTVRFNSPNSLPASLQQWRTHVATTFPEKGNGMSGLPYINTSVQRTKRKSTYLEDGINRTIGRNKVYRSETEETLTKNIGLLGNVRKRRRVEKDYELLVRGRYQRNSSPNARW